MTGLDEEGVYVRIAHEATRHARQPVDAATVERVLTEPDNWNWGHTADFIRRKAVTYGVRLDNNKRREYR